MPSLSIYQKTLLPSIRWGLTRLGQLSTVPYLGKLTTPQGDFDAALSYHGRALKLAEQLGVRSRISAETSNLAEILFYLGDWARAQSHAGRAVELARSASSGLTAAYFQYADVFRRLGMVRGAMGEWEDAVACPEESLTLAEGIPYVAARWYWPNRSCCRGDRERRSPGWSPSQRDPTPRNRALYASGHTWPGRTWSQGTEVAPKRWCWRASSGQGRRVTGWRWWSC